MDLKSTLALLGSGLDFAAEVAPKLKALGLPYAGVAAAFIEVAQTAVARVEDNVAAYATEDRDALKVILLRLQAESDGLAAEIEAS